MNLLIDSWPVVSQTLRPPFPAPLTTPRSKSLKSPFLLLLMLNMKHMSKCIKLVPYLDICVNDVAVNESK